MTDPDTFVPLATAAAAFCTRNGVTGPISFTVDYRGTASLHLQEGDFRRIFAGCEVTNAPGSSHRTLSAAYGAVRVFCVVTTVSDSTRTEVI